MTSVIILSLLTVTTFVVLCYLFNESRITLDSPTIAAMEARTQAVETEPQTEPLKQRSVAKATEEKKTAVPPATPPEPEPEIETIPELTVTGYEYREMLTGVHVTPRISGNRVTLEIETQRDQPSPDSPGVVRTQLIQTRVQGRLNEWIEIGSLLDGSNRQATGHINSSSRQKFRGNHVFVKIAEIHP